MKVDYNKVDSLTASLKVSIAKEDYLLEFEEEIKKQKGKAQLKGFRKGKIPSNYLKKLYGDQVLAEIINKKTINAMYDHLRENKIETILDPIISETAELQTISYKALEDYNFTFELALSPEFEIGGIDDSAEFIRHKVVPTEEELEDNLERIATQLGERITIKEDIQDKDMVSLMADVILTDAEGLTEPIEAEVKVLVEDCKDEFKEQLKKLKLSDTVKTSFEEIEGKDQDFIRKYYLKLEADDTRSYNAEVEASITNVERVVKMDVGPELFKKMFPEEEVTTKEAAIAKIGENTAEEHLNMSNSVMYRNMMLDMMEKTEIAYNEDFLLRWAKSVNAIKPDADEKEFLNFFKDDIKWNLIKSKLMSKYDIQITEEQIKERAKEQVKGYFGYKVADNDQYIDMIAQNLLNDKEQRRKLADEAASLKMYQALENDVKVNIEDVSLKAFYEIVEELNKKK